MRLEGPAERPTTSIGQPDGHHRPLHWEIAHRAHAPGTAGAGLPGIEGSGASSSVHTTRLLPLSAGTAR